MEYNTNSEHVYCQFKDVTEKDMDMLFLEEIVSSTDFADIFLSRISLTGALVREVEHSKSDVEYGESDMTVIVEYKGLRHALLIEDKIDAVAMPNQCRRYFARGNAGIENGDYESFDVFIVAPEKYLRENDEAKEYPYRISYEDFVAYFEKRHDKRSRFKLQQIMQAITNQKTGYQVKENKKVTEFWEKYIEYQKQNYPGLSLISTKGPKGSKATWPQYKTFIREIPIYHKSEKGVVDLNFNGASDKIMLLERMLNEQLGGLEENGLMVEVTGKSAVLRIRVPEIDFMQPFEKYTDELVVCFEAISRMTKLVKKLNAEQIRSTLPGH